MSGQSKFHGIEKVGRMAILADPQNAAFAIIEPEAQGRMNCGIQERGDGPAIDTLIVAPSRRPFCLQFWTARG